MILFIGLRGGPLTRNVYNNEVGWTLIPGTEEELLNIRYVYAYLTGGIEDWWKNLWYMPTQIEIKPYDYKISYFRSNVNRGLTQGVPTVNFNPEFFISLLRDHDGNDILYKDIYGVEANIGLLLENGEEGLYEILNSSPYTQSLTAIMKNIMYHYLNGVNYYQNAKWDFVTFGDGEYAFEAITIVENAVQ